jgi:hypothetical protein
MLHYRVLTSLKPESAWDVADRVEEWTDAAGRCPNVVEVFAVSQRSRQPQLVKAGSPAHGELAAEERMPGERDHQSREHKVLFGLLDRGPRCDPRPARDIDLWDHVSISTSTFTRTCQRVSSAPVAGDRVSSGTMGRRSTRRASGARSMVVPTWDIALVKMNPSR